MQTEEEVYGGGSFPMGLPLTSQHLLTPTLTRALGHTGVKGSKVTTVGGG